MSNKKTVEQGKSSDSTLIGDTSDSPSTFVIPRISHFLDENGNAVDRNAAGVNTRLLRDGTIEHWLNKGYMGASEILTPVYLDN